MEKEHSPDSMATVTIKPEYPPSEYSSEPPPAYHKPHSSAVQVAKIVAVTVVLVSFVLGSFLLASAYVTANASCRQLEQELELLSEAADRFQQPAQLQPEALIQEEPLQKKRELDTEKNTKEIDNNNIDNADSNDNSDSNSDNSSSSESDEEDEERTPIHFRLPLQLDFDDLAGALIEKNQRSRMNCIVEKKRAEEVIDHQPKNVRLPFGVNLTTDPRLERISGERMVIVCESGNFQRAEPTAQPQQPEEDDEEHDTIMIQPVMIPIPHTAFQTHMPQQMPQQMTQDQIPPQIRAIIEQQQMQHQQQQQEQQMRPMHPMETMRPPMPPMRGPVEMRPPMPPMRPPMPPMRPPMEPMMPQQIHFQAQSQNSQQSESVPPSAIIHHIIQQIIAQKIMESQKAQEEQQSQDASQQEIDQTPGRQIPEGMVAQRIPIPEEVLTQLNRLPHNDRVIVAVSQPDSSEENSSEDSEEQVQMVQEQPQEPSDMADRQAYARTIPVRIPVPMMHQVHEQEQEPQAVSSEEARPHYVQPRSIPEEAPKSRVARSANPLLPEKRVKRCACDCAC